MRDHGGLREYQSAAMIVWVGVSVTKLRRENMHVTFAAAS